MTKSAVLSVHGRLNIASAGLMMQWATIQCWRCSVKPPPRKNSVGTKVSEAEFALLEERARGAESPFPERVREALLAAPKD